MKLISSFGRGRLGIICGLMALLLEETAWAAESSGGAKFELRRVLEEGEAAQSETLPVAKPRGDEKELRVEKQALLREGHIQKTEIGKDAISGKDQLNVTLTKEGAKIFSEVTKKNVGKKVAVVVQGKVLMAPVIRSEISGGELVIAGNFTADELKQSADVMRPEKQEN